MGALSKSAFQERLKGGSLVVSPILSGKQLGRSSIDLRMGTVALMSRAGSQSHVDPRAYIATPGPPQHAKVQVKQQKHERHEVPYGRDLLLHPGSLVLVPTLEWVQLPYDLQGIVTARSCWAREGLNIATATIINPSYRGIITLELANFGEIPIRLFPGLRLAQIALYSLDFVGDVQPDAATHGQFDLSFEPAAGNVSLGDEVFLKLGSLDKP